MERRRLGRLEVSIVGLGCNNFGTRLDADQAMSVVDAALEAGINYFDTAEGYGNGRSEEYLGQALGRRRDDAVIATKWASPSSLGEGQRGGDPPQIRARLEASLRRLGTDRIDHYQLHRPDPDTPHEETLGCLADLRSEGKIREIGCSNFPADQLSAAHAAARARGVAAYASVQNHYSLLNRQAETDGVFAACAQIGIAFVPYLPLEAGLLTGKYRRAEERPTGTRLADPERAARFIDDRKLAIVEKLVAWAEGRERTLLDLAISWHTSNPLIVSVIAGASNPSQVRANVAAAGWALDGADRDDLEVSLAQAPTALRPAARPNTEPDVRPVPPG